MYSPTLRRHLFFFLAFFFLFTGSPGQTAEIPTLRTVSKKLPPTASQAQPHSPQVSPVRKIPPTLGYSNNISTVKKKSGSRASSKRSKSSGSSIGSSALAKKVSSRAFIVMDAKTGQTLYAKAADTPRQPASTVKVLTGMIAIQSLRKSDLISVSRKASRMPRSKIYLDPKKKYSANDLINAVLLASANDAAVAVGEHIGGSEKGFARMMTRLARRWGAKRTVCKTASGLTAKGQKSTARDLANIFRNAMRDREFAKRMKVRKTQTSFGTTLYNHNKALWRIKGAQAGKTGYTLAARQTYVGQFQRGNKTIVVAVMGSETMWTDIKILVEYGFKKIDS